VGTLHLIFSRRRSLGSWLIRVFCWSRWSHVSIVYHGDDLIDATLTHRGVRMRRVADLLREASAVEWVQVDVPDEAAALDWLAKQLGRRYDWTAVVGFIFRAGWADPGKWFCSELAAAAIQKGGRKLLREELSRVTPGLLWAVAP
jgi:uncharacterized protein YycO